jgi:Xaa-Pro dipeptidase
MHLDRLHRLQAALVRHDLDCIAAIAGANLYYLTGLAFHPSERPVVGFFPASGDPVIVASVLEETKITSRAAYPIHPFCYDDVSGPAAAFTQAALALASGAAGAELRLAVEFGRMRVMELRWTEGAFGLSAAEPAEPVFAELRMSKDQAELAHMRQAAILAERALTATLAGVRAGMTEHDVSAELVAQLARAGSDADLPFTPIVASGPNAALPHARVTDRSLQHGDVLLVDWGATSRGYRSDLTRTFAIGPVEAELRKIYDVVQAANAAAKAATRPGVTCASVDAAARRIIADAGYGACFTHRVGHGIGLEGHEEPSVHGGNTLVLETGMTFTIEPGLYLPGQGGVRIEDDVVVTATGCDSLTTFPREWQEIG